MLARSKAGNGRWWFCRMIRATKSARLAELDALLNMEDSPSQEAPEEEKAETKEEGCKPSVLAELKAAATSKPSVTKPKTPEKEADAR